MKFSIIGCNGYIARNFIEFLQRCKDIKIFGYDIHEKACNEDIDYFKLDLCSAENINKINVDVDFVFMFAGKTGVIEGFNKYVEFVDVNEKALIILLDHIKNEKSKARLIYPSTRLVYKGKTNKALKEEDEKELNSLYAINKNTCENILKLYNKAFNISFTIIRICIPYGEIKQGNKSYGTIGFFIENAKNNGVINLYGNGEQKRSFIHIEDLCRGLIFLTSHTECENETFNMGGPDVLSIKDIANIIAKKHNAAVKKIDFPELEAKLESGDTIFDDSKINDLGFKYKHNIREELEKGIK